MLDFMKFSEKIQHAALRAFDKGGCEMRLPSSSFEVPNKELLCLTKQ